MLDFFNRVYLGNPLSKWLIAVAIAVATLVALRILRSIVLKRLTALAKRTATKVDDLLADLLKRANFFLFVLLSLYAGSFVLELPPEALGIVRTAAIIVLLLQAALWGNGLIGFLVSHLAKKKLGEDAGSTTTLNALGFVGRIVLWAVIILLVLDNLGVNITTLIAGLGISGVAVALAAQNILGDLFASLSIILDKPFVIGDFIVVDDYMGTVEHIGLKTTRVRSLSGEQIVFSNNDLLKSRIRNYKRMAERRILFTFGVVYETPPEKLGSLSAIIKEVIAAQPKTRFDHACLRELGASAITYEAVYYLLDPDYDFSLATHEAINLALLRRLAAEGISFAYPTSTVHLNR